jgi:predicted HTH domain antitoxin
METIHLELPAALLQAAGLDDRNVAQGAARLLALELFREDKVSLSRAAELCQTSLAAFMDFAAHHGVPPWRYGSAHLAEERQSIGRLGV